MKKLLFLSLVLLAACQQDPEFKVPEDASARALSDPPTCNTGTWYQTNNLVAVSPVYVLDTDFYIELYAYIAPSIGGTWMKQISITWQFEIVSGPAPSTLNLLNVTGASSYSTSGSLLNDGYTNITFNTVVCPLVSGPGNYHRIRFYPKFGKLLPENGGSFVQLTAEIISVTNGHAIGTHDYGMSFPVYRRP